MKFAVFSWLASVFLLTACGKGENRLETMLLHNDDWPFEVHGHLEIVDAHQRGDDFDWAAAIFVESKTHQELGVFIEGNVFKESGVVVESNIAYRILLAPPIEEFGPDTFMVSRIQILD